MRVWRLTRPAYAGPLDGEGARLWGGRWNSQGRPVLYCAASPSLAILESFVHLPADQRSPAALPLTVLLAIDVPDEEVAVPDFGRFEIGPDGADEAVTRFLGDGWLESGSSLALRVRSVVVPFEDNVLLNVRHPAMGRVAVASRHDYRFDPRMVEAP